MTDSSNWERLASRRLFEHTVLHRGWQRSALLYVPRHFVRRNVRLPLLLAFHGGSSDPADMAQSAAFHRIAEREGFLVAYPRGTRGAFGRTWIPAGRSRARASDDTGFARKLIEDLAEYYPVDRARVFAVGTSIGGSLVYELACADSERLAAIAVVNGTMTVLHQAPVKTLPVIHIHGTDDRRVPLEGGRGTETTGTKEWLSVRTCIDFWREKNGCGGQPVIARDALRGVTSYRYDGEAAVELWLIAGAGHAWPSRSRNAVATVSDRQAFDASHTIWKFFDSNTRRPF